MCVCTASTLQRELAKGKGVKLEKSTICKILKAKGYKWLPRAQKPKFSKKDREARMAFAQEVLDMTKDELRRHLAMCMDGVILSVPPNDPIDRENYCHVGETHMWRTRSEAAKASLAGGKAYDKQVPMSRAVSLWGGIGTGGFGIVLFRRPAT